MKKILVIDESSHLRDYLTQKLPEYGFEVISSPSALDGLVKMRNEVPDLVILDSFLSRGSVEEVLDEKSKHPNTKGIPLILTAGAMDKQTLLRLAQKGIRKILTKPLKIDVLLKGISELLGVPVTLDDTPCIIEAHVNEEIVFIEVAQGLNKEKIELLRYKLAELMELYKLKVPRVLVIMSSLEITKEDSLKLAALFHIVLEETKTRPRLVKVLTTSEFVRDYLAHHEEFQKIEVADSLEKVMDALLGEKAEGSGQPAEHILSSQRPDAAREEKFHLRFGAEKVEERGARPAPGTLLGALPRDALFCVVDDDLVIQELVKKAFSDVGITVKAYNNGREFVMDNEGVSRCTLLFLDLLMPQMDGFATMQALKSMGASFPIIVLSALSRRETVLKAVEYGVKSYVVKPLKPELLRRKAVEVLISL
ncbi:response regulator [Spirochaeta thermophila]|uniref:Response regulator n=1 Tax=Winmispira thermophila (strain ATCC 49972 / DSM 6192 / RI 19.B1) TaxID=665571 RepID=E0RT62_WINT6|nr:response regulator [Spirochaeta thermophila]ADN02358.1 response regulator [Spirochaeta thermophila DSM 6192]